MAASLEGEFQGVEKLPLANLDFSCIVHYITERGNLAIGIIIANGSLERYLKTAIIWTDTAIFDLE